MRKKKRIGIITGLLLLGLFFAGGGVAFAGPRFEFDPASGNYNKGEEFTVKVLIATEGKEAQAGDAIINYDSTRLKVKEVTKGDFFPEMDYVDDGSGKLSIYAYFTQPLQTKSGNGTLATITFVAQEEGEATATFVCQAGDTTDSAIWDKTGNDLIDCPTNGSGSWIIGSGAGGETNPSPTPTPAEISPTPTEGLAPTPTPSNLPKAGVATPFWWLLLSASSLILLGLAL